MGQKETQGIDIFEFFDVRLRPVGRSFEDEVVGGMLYILGFSGFKIGEVKVAGPVVTFYIKDCSYADSITVNLKKKNYRIEKGACVGYGLEPIIGIYLTPFL